MKKIIALLLASVMVIGLVSGCGAKKATEEAAPAAAEADSAIKIGISMPTYAEERWTVDEAAMTAKCEELGVEYVTACAEGDSNKQKDQVSTMIAQGINALIIAPNDGNAAAAIIGGTSPAGGKGSVVGCVIGALVMASLENGMSILSMGSFEKYLAKGLVLLFAVAIDEITKNAKN